MLEPGSFGPGSCGLLLCNKRMNHLLSGSSSVMQLLFVMQLHFGPGGFGICFHLKRPPIIKRVQTCSNIFGVSKSGSLSYAWSSFGLPSEQGTEDTLKNDKPTWAPF